MFRHTALTVALSISLKVHMFTRAGHGGLTNIASTDRGLTRPDSPSLGGVWARAFLTPCPVSVPAVPDR